MTFRLNRLTVLAAMLLIAVPSYAQSLVLPSFKDRHFAYPQTIASGEGGAYRVVDYRELRDINGRDDIPEKRVRQDYVSLGVRRAQQDLVLDTPAGRIAHFAVGRTEGAKIITVYLHGQGGSRHQGVDDFTFGGNFNRIKNLMVAADGLYLSPDFSDFGETGTVQVAALVAHYARASAGAPVFIACGSMGGALCWRLADHPDVAPDLSGLLLLGSHWAEGYLGSAAFERKTPVFFGHGSRDTVFPVEKQEAFFRSILAKSSDYPARFVRFETGTHGTPIRMVDWREELNWMLTRQ